MRKALETRNSPRRRLNRMGAMLPFLAICMVFIVGMMAFSVDVSYMHTLRAELRLASDAAARAGTEELRATQSPERAIAKTIEIAAMNSVGGNPIKLTSQDIQLGQTQYQDDGTWKFVPGLTPYQALRVNVRFGDGAPNPSVPLFFGRFWGIQSVAANSESVASHYDQDIVLCLDRSHSMCFDLSGRDWVYPRETRSRRGRDPYYMKPGASTSRWASLQKGVTDFLVECDKVNVKPNVALVTWASDITESNGENQPSPYRSPKVRTEENFTSNYNNVRNKVNSLGNKAMFGGTEMSAGMDSAIDVLTDDDARPLARKTIILMTDGQWNMGRDPKQVALEAAEEGITIHTITFLQGTDSEEMTELSRLTGGKHYHANNEDELRGAFTELARLMPVVLTN
jgi:Ca-activated chloride channel homolog